MNSTRDFYVSMGHKPQDLCYHLGYLTDVAISAAQELAEYILHKSTNFEHFNEFRGILERFQIPKGSFRRMSDFSDFPYSALCTLINDESGKKMDYYEPEFAEQMRDFREKLNAATKSRALALRAKHLLLELAGAFMEKDANSHRMLRLA